MNTEQKISSAVDCLTLVLESKNVDRRIWEACEAARNLLINALLDIRTESQAAGAGARGRDGRGETVSETNRLEIADLRPGMVLKRTRLDKQFRSPDRIETVTILAVGPKMIRYHWLVESAMNGVAFHDANHCEKAEDLIISLRSFEIAATPDPVAR